MQPTANNLLAEISALVLASLLILGACVLLFFGKVDTGIALTMVGLGLGIFGYKIALAAPSAAQQSQLTTQQATLQDLQASQQQLLANHQQLLSQILSMQAQTQVPVQPAPIVSPQVARIAQINTQSIPSARTMQGG